MTLLPQSHQSKADDRALMGDGKHFRVGGFDFENRVPPRRQARGLADVPANHFHQFADGVDLAGRRVLDLGAEAMGQIGEQLDALHGIESEIEFKIVVGMDLFCVLLAGGFGDDGHGASAPPEMPARCGRHRRTCALLA